MCKESLIDFDKYEITNDGKIFSKYKNDYIYGTIQPKGYKRIRVKCTDGKSRYFSFQRVIWYYFNGEIPEDMQVNHIDECKTNNALSNLNLMTPKQNANWGTRNERVSKAQLNDPSKSKKVDQIDLATGEIITTFPSAKEVERELGYLNSNISRCCNGGFYRKGKWVNVTKAYGYGWRYS